MRLDPRAGKPAPADMLVDVPGLISDYYAGRPDPSDPRQGVTFGTSGHRGSALTGTFNEAHLLAVVQAICLYRRQAGVDGPLFMGRDTHALSEPAFTTALEVLAANGVEVRIDAEDGYTPTPAVSHAILAWNRGRTTGLADGIIITPSHNPPQDGGIKYNPPSGGPAGTSATRWIEERANAFLRDGLEAVKRVPIERARAANTTRGYDYKTAYVGELAAAIDLAAIRSAGLRIGVDPMGGSGVAYWQAVNERHGLDLTIVNEGVDPTFRFMTVDWDGKIRMDCSSPHAMAGLIGLRDRFDIAFGSDTDHDRHGIVTPSAGLMNPNHYLAAAVAYLFAERTGWRPEAAVGKTVVSSAMIDRAAGKLGRRLIEVPVGFKWFVDGLLDGSLGFGGEESAGAAFLRFDGSVWTTEKDGILLGLLAAEITARRGRDPAMLYADLTREFGEAFYERRDTPATPEQKAALLKLAPRDVRAAELAGEPIRAMLTEAPGNGSPIGGLKVVTDNGWFAARPSGTEDVCKLYAESFKGEAHLRRIQEEAQALLARVCGSGGENEK
ncbi:MAG: alpha-D-glucose phosphate-specific phosphoglucomutase [Kiritimatiellae bacterium]|nr:alpha-D-glucose phosphate-specific phosphoglucomutase [Kiritimatiellia bacterium]